MNLDETFEQTRRVNRQYGKVVERSRVITILNNYIAKVEHIEERVILLLVKRDVLDFDVEDKENIQ